MRIAEFLALTFASSAYALPVITLPWFGQVSLDDFVGHLNYPSAHAETKTIYQVLKEDKQYSRLARAIDLSKSAVDLLSDPSKTLTFFAVPDSNLPCRHKPRDGDHTKYDGGLVPLIAYSPNKVDHNLGELIQQAEELEEAHESPDKEKHKEALARIVSKIIAYHILPEAYEAADLVQNSTYATTLALRDGSMDLQPLRLSVVNTLVPPRLRVNIFVEVTKRDIKAKNGVIHQISRPLFPPPSVFQETFSSPEVFSFFTSAIQHVGLTGAVDRRECSKGDGHDVTFFGTAATTAFAPTSGAFRRLPRKLKRYLFSPFGRKALKKLLEYHIVPNFVLYTDYFHNSTHNVTELSHCFEGTPEIGSMLPETAILDGDVEDLVIPGYRTGSPLELIYEYNATLPTLLQDHTLQVHIARYKSTLPLPSFPRYFTRFKVNGHHVGPFDIPARNGALHVLPTILDPRKGRGHCGHYGDSRGQEAAWEDWEDWLPKWAIED